MASWEPETKVLVATSRQRWRDVAFLHWPYDPEVVAPLLPSGLEVDTFDGAAWVAITPFANAMSGPSGVPTPEVDTGEVNVRTYVRDTDGRDGLWFLSLELGSATVATALRTALGLPYRWAEVTVERRGATTSYHSHREDGGSGPADFSATVEAGDEVTEEEVSDLDVFLVGRWRAYTEHLRQLLLVEVEHPSWPLRRATVSDLTETLTVSCGLPAPSGDPHVLFSAGVDARLSVPKPTA